jgi:hypothetical protein
VQEGAEPPAGLVPLRKGAWSEERKPPSVEDEARRLERLREAKWTSEALARLGTVPDRVLARELGRSRNSVAIMRRALGIDAVDLRAWDGVVRPQPLSPEELRRRLDAFRAEMRDKKRPRSEEG